MTESPWTREALAGLALQLGLTNATQLFMYSVYSQVPEIERITSITISGDDDVSITITPGYED